MIRRLAVWAPNLPFDVCLDEACTRGHTAPYRLTSGLNGCGPGSAKLPSPDLQKVIEMDEAIFSGRSLHGNVCFQVAKNDVSSLRLYVEPTYEQGDVPSVWFALR